MGGFTSRPIDFNDRKVFSRPQLVPAVKPNVESAEIKTFHSPANRIDCFCKLCVYQITCINKFCPSCMIAVRNKNSLFSLPQYSLQFVTISFSQSGKLENKSLILL